MVTLSDCLTMNRIAVKLSKAAEKEVRKGHPWVFEGGIKQVKRKPELGDLAVIYGVKDNKFIACGFFDLQSPIRIKLFQFKKGVEINEHWFQQKVDLAFSKRAPLFKTNTNAYRLIFGENDGLPSLIADVYDNVLVVKLYADFWLTQLNIIEPVLRKVSKTKCSVLRLSRKLQINTESFYDGQILNGKLDSEIITFVEHGINFKSNVIKGHKTGFFLDHRFNRKRVGELSMNKTVLDVFSYAGGFSVHALVNGAKEVTSVDLSKKALEQAKENARINKPKGKHLTLAGDAFEILNQLIDQEKKYDVIVIDPPSFAKQKSEIDKAIKSYKRLTKLGIRLVNRKGILVMASCSARVEASLFFKTVEEVFKQQKVKFQLIEKHFHDIDHPIGFSEGAYLKAGYYLIL